MNRHVIGLFYDPGHAHEAIKALIDAGVEPGEISMLATEDAGHFELVESNRFQRGSPPAARSGAPSALERP